MLYICDFLCGPVHAGYTGYAGNLQRTPEAFTLLKSKGMCQRQLHVLIWQLLILMWQLLMLIWL